LDVSKSILELKKGNAEIDWKVLIDHPSSLLRKELNFILPFINNK
jgi:hypothetical protein